MFRSWDNPRAVYYRRMNDIPGDWGTAVNVQSMVFGNMGDTSGTGVAFTRNPATGEKGLYGEFLMNAQGEDVVAGIRTPRDDRPAQATRTRTSTTSSSPSSTSWRSHYRDMQDMEFTIEEGKLFMLQTRNGKRTAAAAFKIACDLVDEGMITQEKAVRMIDPKQLDALLHPQFDADALKAAVPIGKGLPASPGAACGKAVFTAEHAAAMGKQGEDVILVRLETTPEDIEGMHHAKGILTARGGMTSHAAVVARGMGTCCVSGLGEISFGADGKSFTLGGKTFNEGDWISLDGSTGNVYGESHRHRPGRRHRLLRPGHRVGRRVPHAEGPHQRRHPGGRPPGPRVRRRGHRPVPHRAHVLRARPDRGHPRDDRLQDRRAARGRAGQAAADAARRLRGHLRGHGRAARSPSGSSTRRCTSSCRTDEDDIVALAAEMNLDVAELKDDHRLPARVQPDDGPPRLPPRRHLPRDRRHADPGDHRGRDQRPEGATRSGRSFPRS